MGERNTVPDDVRAAIVAELRYPQDPPRSRNAIAREHGVAARTVSRYAEAAGIDPADAWRTDTIAAATQAATDRRRALRSQLADELLTVEVPALRARMASADEWERSIMVPGEFGGAVERVNEDDAVIARGLKDLHAGLKTAVDQTIAIDKTDTEGGDSTASDTLDRLFGGLDTAYFVLKNAPPEPAE